MTIKVGEFVRITNEELANDGLETNSIVYVASVAAFPVTDSDGYTQRIKLFVHKTTEKYIDIKAGAFVIDPSSVDEIVDQGHYLNKYLPEEDIIDAVG